MDSNARKSHINSIQKRLPSLGGGILFLIIFFVFNPPIFSKEKNKKEFHFDGSKIEGQREKPRDLYILPWKKTDVLKESDLPRDFLDVPLVIKDRYQLTDDFYYFEQVRGLQR